MEFIYFDKIFDFSFVRAEKLLNSSYLESLTGLFERVAACVVNDKHYHFSDTFYLEKQPNEPNSSYSDFIEEFKKSFNSSAGGINIIRGRAGIGKTLFFKQGVQQLIRIKDEHKDKYIKLGVDFKNIDQKKI